MLLSPLSRWLKVRTFGEKRLPFRRPDFRTILTFDVLEDRRLLSVNCEDDPPVLPIETGDPAVAGPDNNGCSGSYFVYEPILDFGPFQNDPEYDWSISTFDPFPGDPYHDVTYNAYDCICEGCGCGGGPPELDFIPDQGVNEGVSLAFTATATDPDEDPLLYSLLDAPDGAFIDEETGEFTWQPGCCQAGDHLLTVVVSDGQGGEDSQEFTITVAAATSQEKIALTRGRVTDLVTAGTLSAGQGNALTAALDSAVTHLNNEDGMQATGQLAAFTAQVADLVTEDVLEPEEAATLEVPSIVYWDGDGDGLSGNDALNWNEDILPSDCDDVYIDAGNGVIVSFGSATRTFHSLHSHNAIVYTGFLSLAADSAVRESLDFDGTLEQKTGTLELTGGGELTGTFLVQTVATIDFLNGDFEVNDGTLFDGAGQVNAGGGQGGDLGSITVPLGQVETRAEWNLKPKGVIDGPGLFRVSKSLNWSGGTMKGPGTTLVVGAATVSITGANVDKILDGRTLYSLGTVRVEKNSSPSKLVTSNGAALVNSTLNGKFEIESDFEIAHGGGTRATFLNDGTFSQSVFAFTSKLDIDFTNNRTVKNDGLVMEFRGAFEHNGTVDGSGQVNFRGTMDWRGGGFVDSGLGGGKTVFHSQAEINMLGAFDRTINRPIENEGTLTWYQGTITFGGGQLTNRGTFVMDPALDDLLATGQNGTITNEASGTIQILEGTNTVTLAGNATNIFHNAGFAEVAAVLVIKAEGNHSGWMNALSGARVVFDGAIFRFRQATTQEPVALNGQGRYELINDADFRIDPGIALGADNLRIEAGKVRGAAGSSLNVVNLDLFGGEFLDQGLLVIRGPSAQQPGTMRLFGTGPVTLEGWTVLNQGIVTWFDGDVTVKNGASINNDGSTGHGVFDIHTDKSFLNPNNNAGEFVVTNNGVVRKSFSPGGNEETFIDMVAVFSAGGSEEELQGSIRFRV